MKAVPNLTMRAASITICAARLRVSELLTLTARNIGGARMITVRKGEQFPYPCYIPHFEFSAFPILFSKRIALWVFFICVFFNAYSYIE